MWLSYFEVRLAALLASIHRILISLLVPTE